MMDTQQWQQLFGLEGKLAVVADIDRNSSPDVAKLFARAGADVVIIDRDREQIEQLADDVREQGARAWAMCADLEREHDVIAVFTRIVKEIRSPDILVNCMAVNANQPLAEFPLTLWDEVQSINLRAVFLTMRECIKHMMVAKSDGRIINITTMGARHPVLHGNGAYAASRFGVTGLTRAAALDYAPHGIRINEVLPGAIPGKVRFHASTENALNEGRQLTGPATDADRRLPLGYGKPEDIAAAALYLAGPSGSYITGQAIPLDGGFLIS